MLALATLMAIPLVWGLVAGRLARWSITAPIAMVVAGFAMTAGSQPLFVFDLDTSFVEHVVEVVLAVVLFIDATEVQGGTLGRERNLTLRLLLLALPLSLVLAAMFGALTFPNQTFWLLTVIATVVMPTDLAPVASIIRDRRVPHRLRELLNVESGWNDGFVAPIFVFCLAAADARNSGAPNIGALIGAIPATLVAAGVGAVVGFGGGWLLTHAYRRSWTEPSALRVAVVALPLVSYGLSVAWHGNGFVAAFVAGVLFRRFGQRLPHDALSFVEDTGFLLGLAVWFLFGHLINQTLEDGTEWAIVLFAVFVLVVARPVPVLASLTRTATSLRDRAFLGWVGPRGLASIAFGLLAYIDLEPPENELVAEVMVVTVLLSVLLHGATALPLAKSYVRWPSRELGVDTTSRATGADEDAGQDEPGHRDDGDGHQRHQHRVGDEP